jgi:hypothetical protein
MYGVAAAALGGIDSCKKAASGPVDVGMPAVG